ncbi:MAG: DPP IV N-terminal domain-containing protein [Myxococcota bacterium]
MLRSLATLAVSAALLVGGVAHAQGGRAPIVVTPGSAKTYRFALQRFADRSTPPVPQRISDFRDAVADALEYSGAFTRIDEKAFLGPETTEALEGGPPVVCSDWTSISADALIEGEITRDARDVSVAVRVWDTVRCKDLLRKRYRQPLSADPDVIARRIADAVVEAFTGTPGVSGTEIAFVSDRTGNKEIFVMNADGSSARAATANGSINNFPDWSADGDAIVYTSYRYRNEAHLFLSSRGSLRPGRLVPGLNRAQYRAVFDPTGDRLAAVVSDGSAPDLYLVDARSRNLKRLTRTRAIEVSPAWSPDGKRLAFVSDKTGAPQIYVMEVASGAVRRLTYDGSYNTGPSWSPDGRWIAYETRVGGQFDIWLIDPEGRVNQPLVSHRRSDEGPTWAPDSRKIAFSSTRRGRADLYVIDLDGSNLRRLTSGAGDNTRPAWGPYPR